MKMKIPKEYWAYAAGGGLLALLFWPRKPAAAPAPAPKPALPQPAVPPFFPQVTPGGPAGGTFGIGLFEPDPSGQSAELTRAARTALIAEMTAKSVSVASSAFDEGEMTIADAQSPQSALGIMRDASVNQNLDVWVATPALAMQNALVVFTTPGHLPQMESGAPPLASSPQDAALSGFPRMVLFSKAGEVF